jgi:hypothetical protein
VRAVADAHGARLQLDPRVGGGLVAEVVFDHMTSVTTAATAEPVRSVAWTHTAGRHS